MSGIKRIAAERERQRLIWHSADDYEDEPYSADDHDDSHVNGELARAAAVYALPPDWRDATVINTRLRDVLYPLRWDFRPGDRIRELVKAGALIVAEIDRLERAESVTPGAEG